MKKLVKTVSYILALIIDGLVTWFYVPGWVVDVYIRLGGTGSYVDEVLYGGLGALAIVIVIGPGALVGTVINGILGYRLAQSRNRDAKLYLIIVFALIGMPIIATLLFLVWY